jgi:hypothetical protein
METLRGFPSLPAMVRAEQSSAAPHAFASALTPCVSEWSFPRPTYAVYREVGRFLICRLKQALLVFDHARGIHEPRSVVSLAAFGVGCDLSSQLIEQRWRGPSCNRAPSHSAAALARRHPLFHFSFERHQLLSFR